MPVADSIAKPEAKPDSVAAPAVAPPASPVPVVMMTTEMQQRQQLAAEIAALRQTPPDVTEPGGRFVLPDGAHVDAHGKPLAAPDAKASA